MIFNIIVALNVFLFELYVVAKIINKKAKKNGKTAREYFQGLKK